MALQFTEVVTNEWTDGVLLVQTVQEYCNGKPSGEKTRLMQYGRKPSEIKQMRRIHRWNGGPMSGNRRWSPEELELLMQEWLQSIGQDNATDYQIVESLQLLVRGTMKNGSYFPPPHYDDNNMHYLILCLAMNLIDFYKSTHTALESNCESLTQQMGDLTC
jgi:hypothetical protein